MPSAVSVSPYLLLCVGAFRGNGKAMIHLRTLLQRCRRSVLVAGALALVCLAVAWTHSAPAAHDMDVGGDDQMAPIVSICLAVVQIAVGLLAAVVGATTIVHRRAPRRSSPTATTGLFLAQRLTPPVAARAGPAALQVFRR